MKSIPSPQHFVPLNEKKVSGKYQQSGVLSGGQNQVVLHELHKPVSHGVINFFDNAQN